MVVILPGPPSELQRLWPRALETDAVKRVLARTAPPEHRVLRFFGASESEVARTLTDAGGEPPGVVATICARDFEIHVDLYGPSDGLADVFRERLSRAPVRRGRAWGGGARARPLPRSRLDARDRRVVHGRARRRAPHFGAGIERRVPRLDRLLRERREGAGARRAARDARAPRRRVRGDRRGDGRSACGRVCTRTSASSVTGVAGPGGGSDEKPVGLVYVHAETPEASQGIEFTYGQDRASIRRRATVASLHLLRRLLTQNRD